MARIEKYYVGTVRVKPDEWWEVYDDDNNYDTLTIKYEEGTTMDYQQLQDKIESLEKELDDLKNNKMVYFWTNKTPVEIPKYCKTISDTNYGMFDLN